MASRAQRPLAAFVLAAGESKRFRSATPKVLHDLCGRPMLAYVLDAVAALRPARAVVVVGREAERVQETAAGLTRLRLTFARQASLVGTADAVRTADDALGSFDGDVLVVQGDAPLLTAATLRALVAKHRKTKAAATILTTEPPDPARYGRVVRDAAGRVTRIVEALDAGPGERATREVNAGIYVFDREALRTALPRVERANRQGELYLTDVIGILHEKGETIEAQPAGDPIEVLGVKNRARLAEIAAIVRARTNARLMEQGVTIVDPAQTYIDATVRIGRDTVIHPLVFLTGATVVGAGCEIGPATRIADSRIEDGARVQFSVLGGARVGKEANVGPYAYLRPGARLAARSKVGTFVEVKNSAIGEGTKVPHLSYVGDADVGRDVNIGAATVTVNYDNETGKKSRTVIGDGAKIGSDTMLVAPVRVGKGAVTGAGSVVTRDLPPNTLAFGVPAKPVRKRKPKGASE